MLGPVSENHLRSFQQPARYLGGEPGSVCKLSSEVELRICLAFPDRYEVGISHLGLQILYDLVNRYHHFAAERVYLPLPDYEKFLRNEGLLLCSLESHRPLLQFDVVGFSLQYELCATEVLAMLDLGGIPIVAAERGEHDPIIIAGGPVTTQPEPFAQFFDAMVVGDGEEALIELLEEVRAAKLAKAARDQVLARLATIKGIYVPSYFIPHYDDKGQFSHIQALNAGYQVIERRVLPSLADAPFPRTPLVPCVKAVHERLTVEIMRGCVRGCRFCQAGFICRPQRERPMEEVIGLVEDGLLSSGYDEVSLLSLSTTDYCNILPLLLSLQRRLSEQSPTTISFPSSRVDTLHPKLLGIIQKQRSSSFTIAPEAGTQRLRDVINKRLTDQEILATCQSVFEMGFKGLKLYFMIGLPTETDQDLVGIVTLAKEIKRLASRRQTLTVSVSGFVPKAHTPFQWAEQIPYTELLRRQDLLRIELRKSRINYRYHEAGLTILEGIIARGDREVATLIREAYKRGCRINSASQESSWENWNNLLVEQGLSLDDIQRRHNERESLPWQHINTGIDPDFLALEWRRAVQAFTTADCLDGNCAGCGVCNSKIQNVFYRAGIESGAEVEERGCQEAGANSQVLPGEDQSLGYYRVRYRKKKPVSFVSHLELINLFFRALRRAGLPLAFTQGFSPHPKIGFGPPLQLGISSEAELLDLTLKEKLERSEIVVRLNQVLPEGLEVMEAWEIERTSKSIQAAIVKQWFRLELPPRAELKMVLDRVENWQSLEIERVRKGVISQVLLKAVVADVLWEQGQVRFSLKGTGGGGSVKPSEVAEALVGELFNECLLVKTETIF